MPPTFLQRTLTRYYGDQTEDYTNDDKAGGERAHGKRKADERSEDTESGSAFRQRMRNEDKKPVFVQLIRVLVVHKELWCSCSDCKEAQRKIVEHSFEKDGCLQHNLVDKARGNESEVAGLLEPSKRCITIVAVHPECTEGSQHSPR
jgi:hypothetical protein